MLINAFIFTMPPIFCRYRSIDFHHKFFNYYYDVDEKIISNKEEDRIFINCYVMIVYRFRIFSFEH